MNLLQLEGKVDDRDEQIASLEEALSDANNELREVRSELARVRNENVRAVSTLKRQLSPLYQALQAVFGEIETVVGSVDEAAPVSGGDQRVNAVWESWKRKLGGQKAQFIDGLLQHGQMTAPQLRVVMGCATQTVYDTAAALNKLGLIQKNGSQYSLKKL